MSASMDQDSPLGLSLNFSKRLAQRYRDDSFWQIQDVEAEFGAQFAGLINMYLTSSDLKEQAINAILQCFHRLDVPFVRRECLRLVSLACWKTLSEERREKEFGARPQLREAWPKAKTVSEGAFFGRLIDDCVDTGSPFIAQLFLYCLLQWPTRRYLSILLDDKSFVVKCRQRQYMFVEQVESLLFGSSAYDPNSDKAEWTEQDFVEDFYDRIEQFQSIIYSIDPTNVLASVSLYELSCSITAKSLLEHNLNDDLRVSVCNHFGWRPDDLFFERLAQYLSAIPHLHSELDSKFPDFTDTLKLDEAKRNLLPITTQFLNLTDYLFRFFKLIRTNFTESLKDTLSQALHRSKPAIDKKLGLVYDGWFRYSSQCHHVDDFIYQFTLSPMTSATVVNEWQRLKVGDYLYLCKIVPDGQAFKYDYAHVASVTGIVRESRNITKSSTATIISDVPTVHRTATKLLFTLDRRMEDANFVVRLDPKDNSLIFIDFLHTLITRKQNIMPNLDMGSFLYGQKSGSVSSVEEWIGNADLKYLLVEGPANSGKSKALIDILKANGHSKIVIMLPTVEQCDIFSQHLVNQKIVDESYFLRLGYSPAKLSAGRVESFMEWRARLLQEVDEYFETIGASAAIASSCEAAIACLENLSELDDTGKVYLEQLRQLEPLEYIQDDDRREAYLFKYHARVTVMTFGYAAVNAKMLGDVSVDYILMDDCNLVSELMTMIPLLNIKNSPRLVFFGDARTEPVSDEGMMTEYNYGGSLFRRLRLLDCLPTVKLGTVYNVPKGLAHWFTKCTIGDCKVDFIEVESQDPESIMQSKQNVAEAEELVDYLLAEYVSNPFDCVVLSPYNAQCDLIMDVLTDKQVEGIQVYTVDKLTGSHASIVLCSLVLPRLNSFVHDRLQMLFTRALKKLVIFHSPSISLSADNQ